MLPKIHLGTLITVTDSHLANQSRERKQAIMEARISRNTEGFYVYQTYLKRLRRMHRAYVTRYKQQQQQQHSMTSSGYPVNRQHSVFDTRGNYVKTRQFQDNLLANRDNGHNLPLSKHRISLSGHVATPTETTSESFVNSPSFSSPISSEGDIVKSVTAASTPKEKCDITPRPSFSIHIPCGRETSFDLSCSLQNDTRQDNGGALPFRMWKQRRDKSGLPSVYSQNSGSEEFSPNLKPHAVWNKTIPKLAIESKLLSLKTKK